MQGLVLYFMDLQMVARVSLKEMPADLLDDKLMVMTSPTGGYIVVVTTANNLGVWHLQFQGEKLVTSCLKENAVNFQNVNSIILTK